MVQLSIQIINKPKRREASAGDRLPALMMAGEKGKAMEIVWNLPSEGADLDRASELEMCLECFPESPFVEAWTHELEKICSRNGWSL